MIGGGNISRVDQGGETMKSRTGFWLNISLLTSILLLILFGFLHVWAKRQVKVHGLQIQSAFADLELVFPTAFKNKDGAPDLETVVSALNAGHPGASDPGLEMEWHGRKVAVNRLPYRVDHPDGPWQVVLTSDPSAKTVHAAIYDRDLAEPVTVRDYPCCR
jgi:hypothetical protein